MSITIKESVSTKKGKTGMIYDEMISNIESFKNFSFSRFGDGELNCMRGKQGYNCDKHEYFPDLGVALNKVWNNPKGIIAMQSLGYRIHKSWLGKHRWPDADVLHHASMAGDLERFMDVLKDRMVIVVGGPHLRALGVDDHFIEVNKRNAWKGYADMLNALRKCVFRNDVVLYSCGMMAEVLINDLYRENITESDAGSVVEPYVGSKSRKYHYD